MDTRQQDQAQAQAPPPPPPPPPPPQWYPPPPPAAGGYQPHYPYHQPPPPHPHHHHQQQPYHHQPPPPWPPTPPDHSQYQYQTRPLPPAPPPPAPGPYNHGGPPPPPPYPGPYPHPPQLPSYTPAVPPQNYPPLPNQVWGNSSWHHPVGWEQPERSISYNNEEDWAARARAWAEAKSSSDNHHTPMQFTPVGRTEAHDQVYQEPFQQASGPRSELQQSPYSASQQLPVSAAPQKQINHLQDPTSLNMHFSSHTTDARTSYGTILEGQVAEKGTAPPHVNFGSGSSVFEQEVPSSYSSFPGKIDGDQHETLHMPLPPPVTSVQEGLHNSQPALPFQSMEHHHLIHRNQLTTSTVDASDQPLVFEQRFTFEHGQNQKISYRDVDATGSLGGTDHFEALPSSINAWTPPVAFSHVPPVPSGQQHDSSFQSLPSVNVHPAPMFGRIPASSFHPSIPSVRAPFGLGAGAPLHHLSAFTEDASGTFNSVDRPKKASVPNWLREELLKKKASIASSIQEQPTGRSYSAGVDDADKSFGKGDQADSRSIDSTRSAAADDEDDEDDVEAARSAAITQEIKRVLTDILLKVTDDLFEEIATKVIDEDDDCALGVDNNISSARTKVTVSPVTSAAPKSSAKVPVPVLGNCTKVGHVENSSPVSPKGNILGLANYASDDDDEETHNSVTISSAPMGITSHQQINYNNSSENMVKEMEKGIPREKIEEFGTGSRGGENGDKETSQEKSLLLSERNDAKIGSGLQVADGKPSKDASGLISGYGENFVSVPSKKAENFISGHDNDPKIKYTIKEKPDIESKSAHGKANGQFMSDEARKARSKSGSTSRNTDKKSHKEVETGIVKVEREYSDANENRRGDTKHRSEEKMGKPDNLRRNSKDGDYVFEKNVEMSTSRKRTIHESDKRIKEYEKDKKAKSKEENDKKRDQLKNVKEDKAGHGHRGSHRSKSKCSPSPSSRVMYGKSNSFSSHGGASSGEVSDDSHRRKSRSDKRNLSRSPPRSKRRQVSRSPPTKHSQRRHSPYSYSDRRRRSRSSSPVQNRR